MINYATTNVSPIRKMQLQAKSRNPLLYYFGLLTLAGAVVCGVMILTTSGQILGINAYIKPFKFFISISILSFTLTWLLVYLKNQRAVKIYSWVTVLTLVLELVIITGQAAKGKLSHFNTSTPFDIALFNAMGIAILIFTLWTLSITVRFFRQKDFPLWMSDGYKWGIRLGFLFFVIFAFEGGQMAALLRHSIGGEDGSAGLPLVNWSRTSGDLRVAHFFGMHSLQLLPLTGYYFFPKKTTLIIMAFTWLGFVVLLYWQALKGFPLIP